MPRTNEQFNQMKDASRQKIIDAALMLFSRKGLAATSIIDIANTAGVSSGLLYHYFKSKEELFFEIIGIATDNSGNYLADMISDGLSPAEKIRRVTDLMSKALTRNDTVAQYFVLMIRATLEGDMSGKTYETKRSERSDRPIEMVAKIAAQGQRSGEIKKGNPQQLATLYWAAIQGLSEYKLTMTKSFCMPAQDLINGILLDAAADN